MTPTKKLIFKVKAPASDSNLNDGDSSLPKVNGFKSFKKPLNKVALKPAFKPVLGFESDLDTVKKDIPELITGFSGNQVVSAVEKVVEGPLVIPFSGNSQGWRHKRSVNYVPKSGPDSKEKIITSSRVEVADPSTYGLQIFKKVKVDSEEVRNEETPLSIDAIPSQKEPVSLEKEAELALISAAQGETYSSSTIDVIPLHKPAAPRNEIEAFKDDVDSRPDECTLEEYERVPVEQFGAALLRGMGWKDGESIGAKRKSGALKPTMFQPRERLLGLGAKPNPLDKDKKRNNFRR